MAQQKKVRRPRASEIDQAIERVDQRIDELTHARDVLVETREELATAKLRRKRHAPLAAVPIAQPVTQGE